MIKINKKIIILAGAGVIVLSAAAVAFRIYNQPELRMIRALNSGDTEKANDIYIEELFGTPLSKEVLQSLKECAENLAADYESGQLEYEVVMDEIENLAGFTLIAPEFGDYYGEIAAKIQLSSQSKEALAAADQYFLDQEYLSALEEYKEAKEVNPDSKEAEEGIAKSESAYRQGAIALADQQIAQQDYEAAERTLNNALGNLPDDSVLEEKLEGLDQAEIQNVLDEAYSAADSGNWSYALDILEEGQNHYGLHSEFQQAYDEIQQKMPITMLNLSMISHDYSEQYRTAIKDRWGNIYDGGVGIKSTYDGYCLYLLEGKYTKFTGTVFIPVDAPSGKSAWFSVYLDEQLAYYQDNITEETPPITFEVDVSGHETMRIVASSDDTYGPELIFANTSFEKAAAQPSDPAAEN